MDQIVEIPFMDVELPSLQIIGTSSDIFPLDNLIGEIIDPTNLSESFDYLVSHLENKHQREHFWPKKSEFLELLEKQLGDGSFRVHYEELRKMEVRDGAKPRIVHAPPVFKRIGIQAIMRPVENHVYQTLIHNTAASIKGRGMHWLHHVMENDLRADIENMQIYGQSDFKGFYDSIDQGLMMECTREYISDPLVLPMTDNLICVMPQGLSKGLRSSQCFANLFLSKLDKKMCSVVRCHYVEELDAPVYSGEGLIIGKGGKVIRYHYYRYCDDIVFFARDKKEAWEIYAVLVEEARKLKLTIKVSFAIRPVTEGVDFLGYKTFYDAESGEVYSLIRKRTKQKAARALQRVKSRKRRQQIIGSFKGMACHADCKHLYFKLTGQHMAKFSELGLKYTPADGKKRFSCQHMSLGSITNRPIELLDYEKDIKTRWGESRYVVLFHFVGDVTEYKFFTDSAEMKDLLDQMKDRGLLPGAVETTIVQKQGTGALRIYSFS
ncbi:MAG: hypothetical protein J6C81_06360 [Muribaculaceae bacterium]|nr:hypothetical protein [Muribaculaceae bacterium]